MTVQEMEKALDRVREVLADGDAKLAKRRGKFKTWKAVNDAVTEIELEVADLYFMEQADALVNEWENRHGMTGLM